MSKTLADTLKFLTDGADVKRFHTVNTIHTETVGHHSHSVAVLTLIFDPSASRSLIMSALFHDLAEQTIGDIPSPTKRELDPEGRIDELESRIMEASGYHMPHLTETEQRTLKLADIASGALYCSKEILMGNQRLTEVLHRYLGYAASMDLNDDEQNIFDTIVGMTHDFG